MVNKDLGMVTAYAYAVSKGYTGTEEEFAALMADYAAVGQRAEQAATAAAASATAAEGSASDSAASATAAEGFAGNASTAAGNASQAAQNASQSVSAASGSATSAGQSATAAAGSATIAGNKATEAAQSATEAAASATTAGTAATNAQTAQTAAEAAQTAAEDAQAAAEAAAQTLVIDPTLTQPNQAAEAKATGDAISLVKSHLGAVEIVDTASGAIATFADGADGVPVESLTVSMEPIQDLHGQANPYPGGAINKVLLATDQTTVAQCTVSVTDEVMSISGTIASPGYGWITLKNSVTLAAGTYKVGVQVDKRTALTQFAIGTDDSLITTINTSATGFASADFTLTGETVITRIRVSTTGTGATVDEKLRLIIGASDITAWHPYANICPISGRQSVTVWRSGGNLWDEETVPEIINNSGEFVPSSNAFRSKNPIPVTPGQKLYIVNGSNTYIYMKFYNSDGGYVGSPVNNRNAEITVPNVASIAYMYFSVGSEYGNTYKHDIAINYPSTITAYNSPDSVTILLGQTVYGGTVDVTTGEMVVTYAAHTFNGSESNWSWYDPYRQIALANAFADAPARYVELEVTYLCDSLTPYSNATATAHVGNYARLVNNGLGAGFSTPATTEADAKAYLAAHPVTFVYELATPLTITLTPEQLTTVLGVNNVWSDGGDVSVDYVADTKLYISQLTEPDADMVADANITSGQYFMVGNGLYLATANIANGSAIVPGTNCTRTNLAAALNAINA